MKIKTSNWLVVIVMIIIIGVSLVVCSCEKDNTITDVDGNTITDVDGNIYKVRDFGDQTWMVENLKTTHFNDGSSIPLVENQFIWDKLSTPAYCYYDNDNINKNLYGVLYNGYTIVTYANLCPYGWHVPTDNDWLTLIEYTGGLDLGGDELKDNEGFSATLGGMRGGEFLWKEEKGTYQSSMSITDNSLLVVTTYSYQERNDFGSINYADGVSVRCIKNK